MYIIYASLYGIIPTPHEQAFGSVKLPTATIEEFKKYYYKKYKVKILNNMQYIEYNALTPF